MVDQIRCWFVWFFISSLLMLSCAQIGTPQGGPKDEAAPVMDLANSTPGEQVFFEERKIKLTFDEWIQLSNPSKEVFVSPPLDYPPKISSRGKTLTFEFSDEEVLKENTTYQINFGKAVKDLRAGNEVENLVFLFSTGETIDQLQLAGSVQDGMSGKPVSDVVVMLYDNLSDSCFTTIKPLYLTRTDKEGLFELKNLRADTFQIFALKDENVSYTYDVPTELVGFHDSLIVLTDSIYEKIVFDLFDEADAPRFIQAKQTYQGLIDIMYQPPPEDYAMEFIGPAPDRYFTEVSGDTIKLWHNSQADSLRLVINSSEVNDTVQIKKSKKNMADNKLVLVSKSLKALSDDTFRTEWNLPLDSLDLDLIKLSDTMQNFPFTDYGVEDREFWFRAMLAPAAQYTLSMDSLALRAWSGQRNVDSLGFAVTTLDPERFGNIMLTISEQDTFSYLMDVKSGERIVNSYVLDGVQMITMPELEAGKYVLKLTQDRNGDGRWTAGSIKEKRKPETIKELTLEELKAGWDLEATVDIQEIFNAAKSN